MSEQDDLTWDLVDARIENAELRAENTRLRTRLANVERDLRQHREMRAAADVVRVPLIGSAT